MSSDPREAAYDRAVVAHQEGRYAEAARDYERAAEDLPTNGRVRANYAVCLAELARFDDAINWARRALAMAADDGYVREKSSNALAAAAWNLIEGERFAVAEALAEEATKAWISAYALGALAATLAARNRWGEARAMLVRARDLDPANADVAERLATVDEGIAMVHSLIASQDEAIARDPEDPVAWKVKGDLLHSLTMYDEAMAAHQRADALATKRAAQRG